MDVDLGCLDVGRIRFAAEPFPLLEALVSLRSLRPGRDARRRTRWQAWVATHLPSAARPLLELVSVYGDATMFAAVPETGLDRALAVLRATPDTVVRERLHDASGERALPQWVSVFVGVDGRGRHQLCHALRSYFTSCLLPYWRQVEASHARESARFGRDVLRAGIRAALSRQLPDAVFHHGDPATRQPGTDPREGAVMLAPSCFWTGDPWMGTLSDGTAVLVYSPADSGTLFHKEIPDRPEALRQLLGHTRAAVLCSLSTPCGTTELASRVEMSLATTSEHTAVLRAAGLIVTTRRGRSVQHLLTDLGRQLVCGT
ncbi:hypothetical protein [Streptomyces sp. NPDC006997]|uniref:ArsR/SmtB family transcription factor n=1 Tax=Streptomyces sp. NPDC006997 TaxID=3155356 RepID=UPI0034116FAE